MADTIREKIILDALTQLAKITVANGYNYTMETPLRAQKNIPPSKMPVSVIFPGIDENERLMGKENLTMTLNFESHQLFGSVNASVMQEKMLGDLRRNLTNPAVGEKWSTYTDDILYQEGGPAEQPDADNTVTAVYILLTVKYKTVIGDPYTQ
ncbi:MAG: hypothetical protein GY941_23725 [Planctomycetes bacterium]|nr:hypothetical protein [Planctomycetota bacterium]